MPRKASGDVALKLVKEFMEAVDKDKEEGLDPDTARLWRDQVHEIAAQAKFDQTPEGDGKSAAGPSATAGTDHLAPLKSLIEQATYTMEAATREMQDPNETVLRGFGKQLGSSKKEITALSKDLVINQPTGVAMEASRLAGEACDAIKASREAIRAALREMGAASDISESSGSTRAQWAPPARSAIVGAGLGWAAGARSAAMGWAQRPVPARPAVGDMEPEWPPEARPATSGWPPAHTPATTAWPPMESLPRPKLKGADGELSALMRGMMNAQANDSGWPTFSGKYVEYPRFRKEWWAYRQTYHGHVRDELVCRSLKERSLASNVRVLVNDIDDLREAWGMLDTCFDRPEKYISEALEPVIKFRSYKAFDSGAIREFYSILRAAMMGARTAGLLGRLINYQTLPAVLAKMPPTDWRQWAKERPVWMRESIEEAFWNFVDQKWRDALNVAVAEPPAWGTGSGGRINPQDGRKEAARLAKADAAAVHVTGIDGRRGRQGDGGRVCVFKDVMGCSGSHPPWFCKAFGKLPAKERERLITDNRLCPFCLLHDKDKPCGAKERTVSVACTVTNCKGRHIQKLHDFLKDVFREEKRVHMVHGDAEWEESDEAWELGEEEMIVGTVQQEDDCTWQETCSAWMDQSEEATVSTGQKVPDQGTMSQCEDAEAAGGSEETPELEGLELEGEEQEYFLKLLMRKTPPEQLQVVLAAKGRGSSAKGRKGRKKEKGASGKNTCGRSPDTSARGEKTANPASKPKKQVAPDLDGQPEVKGRGVAKGDHGKEGCSIRAPVTTSGGECSRQKMPG